MLTVANGTRVRQSYSVVLMARLVDRYGCLIGADTIDSIVCSVYQVVGTEISGVDRDDILLCQPPCVAEVVLDELYRGPKWDAEEGGFNFRHRFVIPRCVIRLTDGARFEARYVFTQVTGEVTTVRFRIRAIQHD